MSSTNVGRGTAHGPMLALLLWQLHSLQVVCLMQQWRALWKWGEGEGGGRRGEGERERERGGRGRGKGGGGGKEGGEREDEDMYYV